jgi:NAD(P)-dependent dehydrogenase (short-subunit alcohol dehydrogenase family)
MIPKPFTPDADLLAGRVILITGAGSGLGRALAVECARAGASVILCGRSLAKLERVYDEIEGLGKPRPAIAALDLAAATAVDYDNLAKTIGSEFGKLDGLVHAAALLGDRTPLEQYDVPTWCRVLHVNLTAPFILTPAAFLGSLCRREVRIGIGAQHVVAGARGRAEYSGEQRQSGPHAHGDAGRRLSGRGSEHGAGARERERNFFVLAECRKSRY